MNIAAELVSLTNLDGVRRSRWRSDNLNRVVTLGTD
jgi:hypothetical protein